MLNVKLDDKGREKYARLVDSLKPTRPSRRKVRGTRKSKMIEANSSARSQ